MIFKRLPLLFSFLFLGVASAFQDSDIDGVEDKLDLCPNTSFEILVNKDGCPQKGEKEDYQDKYWGRLSLRVGVDIARDSNYENSDMFNLYANYRYHNWDASLSNARTTTNNSYTEDNSYSDSDIYLSTGYLFNFSKNSLKLSIGTKIVSEESSQNSSTQQGGRGFGQHANQQNREERANDIRKNDYFSSLNFNHSLNNKQDIFIYYGYTLSGDSTALKYENYALFSLGTGYEFDNYYTGLSYNYTGFIYPNSKAEESISWFNSYLFSKNMFSTASYRYALEDLSYEHILSFSVGIYFE